ncbi:MAG: hypothetical protein Q4P72_00065 [Eubacteriales bacterium]|nr:hypothetical protein [Eubacteriales bacterium]
MATPSAVYCQPEIATVGLSEEAAKSIDPDACAVQASTISNGKSLLERSERGFIKLIYSQSSRRFLGASLYCMRASDLISELALALSRKLSIDELKANIRPHPSYSELISEALHQVPWPEA